MDFGLPIGINAHTRKAGHSSLSNPVYGISPGCQIGILLLIGSKIHPVERFRSRSARPDGLPLGDSSNAAGAHLPGKAVHPTATAEKRIL